MHDSGESLDDSVYHTITNMTSPSVCESHDLSVCQPKHDSTWSSVCPSLCPSSVLFIQPSAKFMVIIPTSIAIQYFLKVQFTGKFPYICTSSDSSVDPSRSPSITLSPSAENPSIFPGNNGEKMWQITHQIPVKLPIVHTS